jgi:hypothetical protein
MAENYRSPYGIWWDENIQGKYGVSDSIRELMAMAFEGGRQSKDAEIEALKPYKEKIEQMERMYNNHYAQAMGNPKLKKASEK